LKPCKSSCTVPLHRQLTVDDDITKLDDLGVPGDTSAPAFQDASQRVLAAAAGLFAASSLPTPRPRADTPTKACASSASAPARPCSP
jgi:hypothetical protein